MSFTQPTIHHVLYVESDALQIARYGFVGAAPKSIWFSLDDDDERDKLDAKLARLHKRGLIKIYYVGACMHGDDSSIEMMHEELNELDCVATGFGTA